MFVVVFYPRLACPGEVFRGLLSPSCCMERSGSAASSGFEKTLKNKRHWIPIFIGMTRENLEKQKKRHTVLDTVSSGFTGEARSVLKN